MLIVMKFGGTSVGSAERIGEAAELVIRSASAGHQVVVVTSAMSGITNQLVAAAERASRGDWDPAIRETLYQRHAAVAEQVIRDPEVRREALAKIARRLDQLEKLCFGLSMVHELTPRLLDAISGVGECLSAPLLAGAIASRGHASTSIEATELIVTTDQFGAAEPLMDLTTEKAGNRLRPLLEQAIIPVVTGFIAATGDGVSTTLGRGGSDYSASILGAVLGADEIWIWTDVNGVMSANPTEVPEARTLREISYSEASELAYYGAKVLHYKTILPACERHIPVLILNSFNPDDPGTRVTLTGHPSSRGVKAVTSFHNVSMITISGRGMQGIPGIAAKAFSAVASTRASIMMISQASSENNLCFVIGSAEAPGVLKALRSVLELDLHLGHIESIEQDQSVAVVAVVGDRMKGTPGISGRVFGALGESGVNVIAISQGSSELNISLIVSEADAANAVRAIHRAFQLDQPSQP
jgi:aspartokinase/homoserine dehydrogenase 1